MECGFTCIHKAAQSSTGPTPRDRAIDTSFVSNMILYPSGEPPKMALNTLYRDPSLASLRQLLNISSNCNSWTAFSFYIVKSKLFYVKWRTFYSLSLHYIEYCKSGYIPMGEICTIYTVSLKLPGIPLWVWKKIQTWVW